MLIGGGVLVVGAAIAIVLAVLLGRGSPHADSRVPVVGSTVGGLPEAAAVNSLFKGIPQHGTTLGAPGAPVTMVEYIDLQCPFCQQFETETFPGIVGRYVRTGKAKVLMRPWAFIGPDSVRGQAAVLAAAVQGKAFNLAALLYDNQGTENTGWLNEGLITAAASSIPHLFVHQLLAEQTSSKVTAEARHVGELAQADHIRETPTILVGKSGEQLVLVKLRAPTDERTLARAIETSLRP